MPKAPGTIGVRKLHYAKMTTEDTATTAAVYDVPKFLAETVNISVTPNEQKTPAYADNGIVETFVGSSGGEVSVQIHSLPRDVAVDLLGLSFDKNGVVLSKSTDTPSYVALGFEASKGDGTAGYFWIYKVKLAQGEMTLDTKTDTVTWQQPTLSGSYLQRQDTDLIKAEYYADTKPLNKAVIDGWFDAVYEPVYEEPVVPPEE